MPTRSLAASASTRARSTGGSGGEGGVVARRASGVGRHDVPVRNLALVLAAALMPAVLVTQSVDAAPAARLTGSPASVGQLAYVAASGELDLVAIAADGSVTSSEKIGPVTTVAAGGTVTVYGPVSSPGGQWLAWGESDQSGSHYSSWVVLRSQADGSTEKINTSKNEAGPLGFVGQRLVISNFNGRAWVVQPGTRPTLKLLLSSLKNTYYGTDRGGVVYESGFALPGHPERIELLRLNGHSTLLHTFPGSMFTRRNAPLEQGWVASDGSKAVFEQGDHTDFGGVGPTSVAFAVSGLHASTATRLGHPGGATPIRRMEGLSFAADTPYGVWSIAQEQTPTGAVYVDNGHGWQLYASDSLVVAGNSAGAVITQPAKYVDAGVEAPAFNIQPTDNAVLHIAGATETVQIQATAMVWLD